MITIPYLVNFLHERDDDPIVESEVSTWYDAAIGFIRSNTGRDECYIETHPEFDPVICVLVAEMHDNRQYTVPNGTINPMIKLILDMHAANLV